jgi:hypothetical protein
MELMSPASMSKLTQDVDGVDGAEDDDTDEGAALSTTTVKEVRPARRRWRRQRWRRRRRRPLPRPVTYDQYDQTKTMESTTPMMPNMRPSTPCADRPPPLAEVGDQVKLQGGGVGHSLGRHGGGVGQVHSQHACVMVPAASGCAGAAV